FEKLSLLEGERTEKTVAEVKNDVLGQIEKKKKELKKGGLPQKITQTN
ncbi:28457_t:CDS:1, partial [Gigaspora margarita]